MKKAIGLATLWLSAVSGLHAADLILESNAGRVQDQAQLQTRLAGKEETVAGIQFDLEYHDSLVKVEVLPDTWTPCAAVLAKGLHQKWACCGDWLSCSEE